VSTFIAGAATTGSGWRVAVKDLIDVAGYPTTNGSKVLANRATPAPTDAVCLQGTRAAEAAGRATIVGKTNQHELAFGVTGINPWFGTPVNPLGPDLIPGGSSSGSAVAVAGGEADIAFGSDTGGSIRIPAACCGVVGLKTTRGRVPTSGVCALAPSLDTIGPMAATVELVASGMALLEPGFVPAPARAGRIGRLRLPATEAIDSALDAALAATDIEIVDVDLPGWDEVTLAVMTILSAEAWEVHAELWRTAASQLSPDVSARLEGASLIDKEETAAAWEEGRTWCRVLNQLFTEVDVIALPTIGDEPPDIDHASRIGEIRHVAPFNLAGVPAIALPVRGGAVVPPSLQLAGPAGSEELLVTTAAAIEGASGVR
jgi:amidase